MLDGIDLSAAESIQIDAGWVGLDGVDGMAGIGEVLRELCAGGMLSPDDILEDLMQKITGYAIRRGAVMAALTFPVLLSAVLAHAFGGRGASLSGMSRSVCFMLTLIPLLQMTVGELEHARETILAVTGRMEMLLPLLLSLLTAVGGSASSAFLHPMVIAASGSMVFLAREVVLRLVMCTCAVTAVNHLSDRLHLTRLAQLLRSAVCWLLGVSFTVFIGVMSLQGVCSASTDGIAIRAAKYAVDNFVPVVGGMFSDTMDTLVGCTLIVKNAFGVTCVLALCGAIGAPLLQTLSSVLAIKLSAAVLEPVADDSVIRAMGDFSRTIVLFLITMLCVGTMYFLLIVQMLLVGNLTVMLR